MTPEKLAEIGHEIRTQDNCITHEPLFCVFEKERISGLDSGYSDDFELVDEDWQPVPFPENYDFDFSEEEDEYLEKHGLSKVYYVERDRFVNAHFTRKAAEEHIRINGHNLNKPFVYVTSLNRCNEMIQIRHFLAKQGT